MTATLGRIADLFAILGGVIMLVIVAVTTTNTTAFILDRIAGLFGTDISGLPGYEDFVQLAISGAGLMFFPYCQSQRGHVAVDLFMDYFPRGFQQAFDALWLFITAFIALFLAYWMVFGMFEVRSDGVVTSVLGWKVWPFYLPGIAALVLWALISATQIFEGGDHA